MGNASLQQLHRYGHGADAIRSLSGARRCLLLTATLGLAAGFAANSADAQTVVQTHNSSTTSYVCTNSDGVSFPTCAGALPTVSSSSTSVAGGANTGDIAANVANAEVESDIEDIRKRRQRRLERRRLGYADEADPNGSGSPDYDSAFSALAYTSSARAPMYMKAAPADSGIERAFWATGTFEHEDQKGTFNGDDIGLRTNSGSGHVGVDYTYTLAGDENYFTWGVFGGLTETGMQAPSGASTLTTAPNGGFYLMWFLGNFTADLTNTTTIDENSARNVSNLASAVAGGGACPGGVPPGFATCTATTTTQTLTEASALATALAENHIEGNIHYKNDLGNNWYWEPTAGFAWSYIWQGQGLQDQNILRLQAGVEFGTSFKWGTATVEPTYKLLAYSDVYVTRDVIPVFNLPVEDDQGQLWGKGIVKYNFKWSDNFATSIEGALYGTAGVENIIGYSAIFEARWTW